MIALDTNVLARAIVEEADADAAALAQQQAARALLSSGEALFLPVTVIAELEWVLRGVYDLPAADVLPVLEDLLAIDNLVVDRAAAVARALDGCRQGMDFSDALHLARAGHCDHLATLDARFRKLAERLELQTPVLAV
jgi:predicted nucleic-acid-binding protein